MSPFWLGTPYGGDPQPAPYFRPPLRREPRLDERTIVGPLCFILEVVLTNIQYLPPRRLPLRPLRFDFMRCTPTGKMTLPNAPEIR
jgi:hypothetical protein